MVFIKEDDDKDVLRYTFILPGVKHDDVAVKVNSNDELFVDVVGNDYTEDLEYSTFIPFNTIPDEVNAELKDGVLIIEIPLPTETSINIK